MRTTSLQDESKEALNRRLEAIALRASFANGWGLFLITIGLLRLAPQGPVPEGTWLIVAGVILLGVNVVRYLNGIRLSGTSVTLGPIALIFGVGGFFGLELPFVAILLIIFGVGIMLRPWLDPLLERRTQ
ncbi:MAG: hypothetical protein HGA45_22260 [Chloroflexales bacterium]|nr:hypothetical protein [Chloroflexales bacterium]